VERRRPSAYSLPLDDTPPRKPADWEPPTPSEADLLTVLAESEAEAEAGLLVSGDEIMRELHESIARMENGGTAADHADKEPGPSRRR
jgi:hypothetical protein